MSFLNIFGSGRESMLPDIQRYNSLVDSGMSSADLTQHNPILAREGLGRGLGSPSSVFSNQLQPMYSPHMNTPYGEEMAKQQHLNENKIARLGAANVAGYEVPDPQSNMGFLQKTIDVLERGLNTLMVGTHEHLTGGDFMEGAKKGLLGQETKRGTDVLGAMGMKEGLMRSGLGLAADILLDPINLIPVGFFSKPISQGLKGLGAVKAGNIVEKGITNSLVFEPTSKFLKGVQSQAFKGPNTLPFVPEQDVISSMAYEWGQKAGAVPFLSEKNPNIGHLYQSALDSIGTKFKSDYISMRGAAERNVIEGVSTAQEAQDALWRDVKYKLEVDRIAKHGLKGYSESLQAIFHGLEDDDIRLIRSSIEAPLNAANEGKDEFVKYFTDKLTSSADVKANWEKQLHEVSVQGQPPPVYKKKKHAKKAKRYGQTIGIDGDVISEKAFEYARRLIGESPAVAEASIGRDAQLKYASVLSGVFSKDAWAESKYMKKLEEATTDRRRWQLMAHLLDPKKVVGKEAARRVEGARTTLVDIANARLILNTVGQLQKAELRNFYTGMVGKGNTRLKPAGLEDPNIIGSIPKVMNEFTGEMDPRFQAAESAMDFLLKRNEAYLIGEGRKYSEALPAYFYMMFDADPTMSKNFFAANPQYIRNIFKDNEAFLRSRNEVYKVDRKKLYTEEYTRFVGQNVDMSNKYGALIERLKKQKEIETENFLLINQGMPTKELEKGYQKLKDDFDARIRVLERSRNAHGGTLPKEVVGSHDYYNSIADKIEAENRSRILEAAAEKTQDPRVYADLEKASKELDYKDFMRKVEQHPLDFSEVDLRAVIRPKDPTVEILIREVDHLRYVARKKAMEHFKNNGSLVETKIMREDIQDAAKAEYERARAVGGKPRSVHALGEGDAVGSKLLDAGWVPIENIYGKGAEYQGKLIHPEIAKALERTGNVLAEPTEFSNFVRMYDKVLNWWKMSVTGMRPQFYITTLIGNIFNNYLAGMTSPKSLGMYTKALKAQAHSKDIAQLKAFRATDGRVGTAKNINFLDEDLAKAKGIPHTYDSTIGNYRPMNTVEFLEAFDQQGLKGSGALRGDISIGAQDHVKRIKAKKIGSSGADVGSKIFAMSEAIETNGKLALFMDSVLNKHMTIDQAGDRVREFLFDYGDLTTFERKVKKVVPFYTFMRKNLALQVRSLALHPEKYVNIEKVRQASFDAAGYTDEDVENMPSWVRQQGFALPGTDGAMSIPNLPSQVLNDMFTSKKDMGKAMLGMITPAVKVPFENVANVSSFTGHPIERFEGQTKHIPGLGPVSTGTANVLEQFGPIRDITNAVRAFSGEYRSPVTPVAGMPVDGEQPDTNPLLLGIKRALAVAGQSGVKRYHKDVGNMYAQYEYGAQLDAAINVLRQEGYIVPTMDDIKAHEKLRLLPKY